MEQIGFDELVELVGQLRNEVNDLEDIIEIMKVKIRHLENL